MTKVRILCDSCSDLTEAIATEAGVTVLPLITLLDGVECGSIESSEVYANMRAGKVYTTAQYPLQGFLNVFEELAKNGEAVLYLAMSSKLSGSYSTSLTAAKQVKEKYPDAVIVSFDTLCASLGMGLFTYKIAELANEGADMETLLERCEYYREHVDHVFTVDDLVYLARGGRISKASAFFANSLDIRPILTVIDGELIPSKKVRGEKRALSAFLDYVRERADDIANQTVWISHAEAPEKAHILAEMLTAEFGVKNFVIEVIGPVIGAHAGPGTLAMFYIKK
jgi:DegV family protein with EDD domain